MVGIKRWNKPVHSGTSRSRLVGPEYVSMAIIGLLASVVFLGCASSRGYNSESPKGSAESPGAAANRHTSSNGANHTAKQATKNASKLPRNQEVQKSNPDSTPVASSNASAYANAYASSDDEDDNADAAQEGDEKDPEVVRTPDGSHISDVGGDALLDANAEAEVEATSVFGSNAADQQDSLANVPTVNNERVEWWINYYTGRGRERFQRHLDHADSYTAMVQGILQENQVADELFYIALIESGFITKARSHAGAVGVWQFIRGTGRRYGLAIGKGIDERKDPMRATAAAARYMTDLYNIFNNWYLAFAAYNCGEYRVLRAIVSGKTRDFWKLSELGLLPKETRHYVPKFLAAMKIARNREQYGFQSNAVATRGELKSVTVPGGTRLSDLSKTSEISLQELVAANPHLLNKRAPTTSKSYSVWVPAEHVEKATASQANLPAPSLASRKNDAEESTEAETVEFHRVARGETLTSIAHEYGIALKKLRKLNGLTMPKVNLRVGQKIKISGPTPSVAQAKLTKRSSTVAEATSNSASKAGAGLTQEEYVFYRVRSGDNLKKIGKRFGVGAEQIKEANSLGRNELYAGELLRVPATGG